jgi:hypothetical protein
VVLVGLSGSLLFVLSGTCLWLSNRSYTTLDTYADLFDDDLDAVAVTLHARYSPEVTRKCGQNVGTHPEEG